MQTDSWTYFNTAQDVAEYTVQQIILAAHKHIQERGEFRLVLAGGTTPAEIYRLLASRDENWQQWKLFLGDERCLPEADTQRNSFMVSKNWLDKVRFPEENFFSIAAELGPEQGAAGYAKIIKEYLPFDVVLLGMGEDGHTASLFPGDQHHENELVHAVYDAPKPPRERVSLSQQALSQTAQLFILVTGKSKRSALQRWQQGENLPVAQISARKDRRVLIDQDARSRTQ